MCCVPARQKTEPNINLLARTTWEAEPGNAHYRVPREYAQHTKRDQHVLQLK